MWQHLFKVGQRKFWLLCLKETVFEHNCNNIKYDFKRHNIRITLLVVIHEIVLLHAVWLNVYKSKK